MDDFLDGIAWFLGHNHGWVFVVLAVLIIFLAMVKRRRTGTLVLLSALASFLLALIFVRDIIVFDASRLTSFFAQLEYFLYYNIPTMISLLIYGICRWRRNMKYGPPIKKKRVRRRKER